MKSLNSEAKKTNEKAMKKIKKNRRLSVLILANIFIICGISVVFNVPRIYANQEIKYVQVVVQKGDTLWDYAKNIAKNKELNISNIVIDIQKANNMNTCSLKIGDIINIPVYE